ncbi:hypothetical protein [Dipodfec virus UOA04_Rod_763]|nr:hypothetical protein [Dipodfec virus UOA04_Rod_763]
MTRNRVPTNLIYQNCYIHLTSPATDTKTTHSFTGKAAKYTNLVEKIVPTGVSLETVELDYPITPEYVNSYRHADYHLDPAGSILKSSPAPNLGDIRDLQRLTSADVDTLSQICSELSSRLSILKQQQKSETADVPSTPQVPEENKSNEVKH